MQTRTRLHDLCAADLMQRELITVNADDPLREVERLLVDAQVSSVPVVDDTGAVLGVVSMRDVVTRYADSAGMRDDDDDQEDEDATWSTAGDEPCASDLMTTEVVRVAPHTDLAGLARAMVENVVHRVLVVENDRLLGLVSTMDVLRAIAEHPPRD